MGYAARQVSSARSKHLDEGDPLDQSIDWLAYVLEGDLSNGVPEEELTELARNLEGALQSYVQRIYDWNIHVVCVALAKRTPEYQELLMRTNLIESQSAKDDISSKIGEYYG